MESKTRFEADILAIRWGVDQRAVLKWMKARGFKSAMDLMGTYGGTHAECMEDYGGTHAECMDRAFADFWEFST
jgi:hypothetical protein